MSTVITCMVALVYYYHRLLALGPLAILAYFSLFALAALGTRIVIARVSLYFATWAYARRVMRAHEATRNTVVRAGQVWEFTHPNGIDYKLTVVGLDTDTHGHDVIVFEPEERYQQFMPSKVGMQARSWRQHVRQEYGRLVPTAPSAQTSTTSTTSEPK